MSCEYSSPYSVDVYKLDDYKLKNNYGGKIKWEKLLG